MLTRGFLILGTTLVLSLGAKAQSDVASGELHGSVTDPSGAVVPGAKVTVTSDMTGLARAAETNEQGEYRILLLPPSVYDVRVEKVGFRTRVLRDVRVTVGQIAILDVHLELGSPTFVVEVSAQPALLESQRSHQADTLEEQFVHGLPIDRRDYLSFTLLAPGVVDSSALADNADFRVTQTKDSGLSFYGSNGRGNSITIDGGEANDTAGGVRLTLSQEAVQEFQINRSNYSAELGGASGGVINIVSKAGANKARGTAFAFFRTDKLDAADPFAKVLSDDGLSRIKPPADRQQFGASLGLPIRKDKIFLFAAIEGLNRDESSVVSVLTDMSIFQPTPEQNAILDRLPAPAAAVLRAALTSPPSTIEMFTRNSGVFPFVTDDWKFSVRLDHQVSNSNHFLFRYNYGNVNETNASIRALVGASRGSELHKFDSTSLLGWSHTFSNRAMNEARFQWNYENFQVSSLERFGPEINISGFGFFNRDIFLPHYTIERRYNVKDDFSYFRGSHNLKFGGLALARGNRTAAHTFFDGRFGFGPLPGGLVNAALASTTITGLQAFNLGLAQSYQQGFGDPTVLSTDPFYGLYIQDSWKVRPNLTLNIGLRYELDDRRDPIPTDTNNFAPRFAFAWDPFNDKKTAVRGGYGIFYSPIYYQIDYVVNALGIINGHRQIAQVLTTIQTAGPAAANNIFTTLRRQGVIGVPTPTRMITSADLAQFGITITHTGAIPPYTVLFENSAEYVNPYSQQASLGIERELTRDLSVSATCTFVRTLKITRARDKNLLLAPVDPQLGIRVWSPPYFVDPLLFQFNVYEPTARAFYSGAVFEVRRRFSGSFSLSGNYTFNRATDEVVDYGSDFQANDQTNLRAERALSSFDQRHKLVIYGLWSAPGRLQVAPVFRANSARPFNLLVGADLNQDRHSTTDRPAFAGRNTGIGPCFWSFDLRLAHKVFLRESRSLELIAEAFNLFNRLNFASVNNLGLGNLTGPFNLKGRRDRNPSEPLGFTSAFDPRRIQLGVRLSF
jgi:hypothetical protein